MLFPQECLLPYNKNKKKKITKKVQHLSKAQCALCFHVTQHLLRR